MPESSDGQPLKTFYNLWGSLWKEDLLGTSKVPSNNLV